MNKIIYTLLFVFGMMGLASCNDYETYADMKEKELYVHCLQRHMISV